MKVNKSWFGWRFIFFLFSMGEIFFFSEKKVRSHYNNRMEIESSEILSNREWTVRKICLFIVFLRLFFHRLELSTFAPAYQHLELKPKVDRIFTQLHIVQMLQALIHIHLWALQLRKSFWKVVNAWWVEHWQAASSLPECVKVLSTSLKWNRKSHKNKY